MLYSIVIGIFVLYTIYVLYFLSGLFRLKRQPAIYTTMEPLVSVVIAARNEDNNLNNLLDDLINQTYKRNKFEIIIVDDRSTDTTWEIINNFDKQYSWVHGIRITEKSKVMTPKKFALTSAIEQSKGDIIISTDADCRVPNNWVSSIVKQFDEETGIVIGYSKIDSSTKTFLNNYQKIDFLALMSANAGSSGWGVPWTGSGQNIAYRKEAFNKINGFKPVADQISGDDFYLVQSISKISKARYNANYSGAVKTQPMASWWSFLSQRTRWASNTRKLFNSDFFFLLFLFLNLFVNTILFCGLFSKSVWQYLPMLFGFKFLFDSLLVSYSVSLFKTPVNIGTYIIWSLLQPIYTPILGIASMIGRYRWKD